MRVHLAGMPQDDVSQIVNCQSFSRKTVGKVQTLAIIDHYFTLVIRYNRNGIFEREPLSRRIIRH